MERNWRHKEKLMADVRSPIRMGKNSSSVFMVVVVFVIHLSSFCVVVPGRTECTRTRFRPVKNGYEIIGSREIFNRALYGGHAQDHLSENYVTFAGDQPLMMGVISDWRTWPACTHAKCGTFMIGVAKTPGVRIPLYYHGGKDEDEGDRYSQWFHKSEGTVSTFRNGWMEYRIEPFFQCFPQVKAFVEVLPLMPEGGFLVHLQVFADQRVILAMGFGGITSFLGHLDNPEVTARNFLPEHCRGNEITLGENRALIEGIHKESLASAMWIGASFPVEVGIGDAKWVKKGPGKFLARQVDPCDTPMVWMSRAIGPGETLEGFVVVIRNEEQDVLDRWLAEKDPAGRLKQALRQKQTAMQMYTPDEMLNLTIGPTVLAMDETWHGNAFYHGTYAWHAPYMGWRNWYGPTVMGWHERVQTAFRTHAATQVKKGQKTEETRYEGPGAYHSLRNSYGYIPEIPDGRTSILYNMQEVGVDMFLHNLEWTQNMDSAEEMFDAITDVLDWEARILDPEDDGLYQNWLNTWISDGHSYNGGNCAQSSAYNYRANWKMAEIARRLRRDPERYVRRANKTKQAIQEVLWQPDKGVVAEYQDTIGNKLIHDSPELATIYHSIECETVDAFQAYQMLRFTETDLRNERTIGRGGRLVWSSNWYPQNYSTCGLYPAENIHLAWAYFRNGQTDKAMEILAGIVDGYFLGKNPGLVAHCMTGNGYSSGAQDFSEISSMYLRTIVEGLFGVRFHLLEDDGKDYIEVSPHLPAKWEHASLKVKDVAVDYQRQGQQESLTVRCERPTRRLLKLPLRSTQVKSVLLNGSEVKYQIQPGINHSSMVIETENAGALHLKVLHGENEIPALEYPLQVEGDCPIQIRTTSGEILECRDPSSVLGCIEKYEDQIRAKVMNKPGFHTVFVRVRSGMWEGWLAADFSVAEKPRPEPVSRVGKLQPVDISPYFNCELTKIHELSYLQPRPNGYSIGVYKNGRYGWDWNHKAYNAVEVNDKALRKSGGAFRTPFGLQFVTPAKGNNVVCASIWENFPDEIRIPLQGRAAELAVFFIGVTNPMQSRVENARFVIEYADGSQKRVSLVNPDNFDDWLNPAVQRENETVYFSDFNHGIVQRIGVDPNKELQGFTVRAVANEVIVGLLGLNIFRK